MVHVPERRNPKEKPGREDGMCHGGRKASPGDIRKVLGRKGVSGVYPVGLRRQEPR